MGTVYEPTPTDYIGPRGTELDGGRLEPAARPAWVAFRSSGIAAKQRGAAFNPPYPTARPRKRRRSSLSDVLTRYEVAAPRRPNLRQLWRRRLA